MNGKIVHDTGSIEALLSDGYGMHIYCDVRDCLHHAELDMETLGKKYGRDTNVKRSILPKMRCTKCGAKKISIRLIAPGTRDSANMVKPRG